MSGARGRSGRLLRLAAPLALADRAPLRRIRTIHAVSQGTYGVPRIHAELEAAGVAAVDGMVGDAYDNAMCESFFATLECELLERRRFRSQTEARMAIFSFIEAWHNPRRRHSGLGYLSPMTYEEAHARPSISAVAAGDRASNRCCQDFRTDAAVKDACGAPLRGLRSLTTATARKEASASLRGPRRGGRARSHG